MFEEDYIMRQIKECVAAAMKLVFNIDTPTRASLILNNRDNLEKLNSLLQTMDEGRIRESITSLYKYTKERTLDDLLIGMDFYTHLCEIDDDILEKDNMNYSDIREDMKKFFSDFGLSNVADLILYD